jgi:VCBS repeat-containing protein
VLTFRLTVTDNAGASASDTVNVTVNDVPAANQPPLASNACLSTSAATPISSGVLAATDPEGQTLTFTLVTNGAKGFATVFSDGRFTYTPDTNLPTADGRARGMDQFVFRATDPNGLSATGAVTIFIDGKLRVMPVGDSITAGVYTGDTPISADRVGYRLQLYNLLTALSGGKYGIQFVGSQSDGANLFTETHHEGRPGWCATAPCILYGAVDQNIYGWLQNNPADIVLLHIGTNDLSNDRTDTTGVNAILNEIDRWEGDNYPVSVFLARIIKDVPNYGTDLLWATYNTNLHTLVTQRPTDRLVEVDMQDGAGLLYGNGALGADMADNLHPNQQGYNKMAEKWKNDILNSGVLPNCP